MPSKVRILDPPPSRNSPLTCDDRSGTSSESAGQCPRGSPLYPVGHRCIWHGFGTARLVGSTYSPPFPHTRLSLRRLTGVKGGACAIASATPQGGALDTG